MKPVSSDHILLKAPNWLGDIVLSLPAIKSIRTSFPSSSICVVGNEIARDIMALSSLDLDFVYFDRRGKSGGGARGAGHVGARGAGKAPSARGGSWMKALGELRGRRWDLGLTFAESFSSALLLRLAGAREVVGYGADSRRLLLTRQLPRKRMGFRPHLVREYMALAVAAGASAGDENPAVVVTEDVIGSAEGLLVDAGVDLGKPVAGICPGAAYGPAKRWPYERFSAVGAELAGLGGSVVVFGAPSEIEIAGEIAGSIPGAVSLAGKTSVTDLAGCMTKCAVVIANDSGAAHLAAAAGVAVVAIFGSTDASWTRPLGANVVVVRTEGMPCAPCFGKECDRGYACLTGISERDVLSAALALAGGRIG